MWSRATPDLPPPLADGILLETPVATAAGWRAAGQLAPGDLVMCFDAGPQPLLELAYQTLDRPSDLPQHWPLCLPPGAFGNDRAIRLMPEAQVLLESDLAEDMLGDAFVLFPAAALDGWRGICRQRPDPGQSVLRLGFARPVVIHAAGGVLISCPAPVLMLDPGPGGFNPEGWAVADGPVVQALLADWAAGAGAPAPVPDQAALRALLP